MSGQSRATTSTITTSSLYPTSPSFSDDGRFAYFSPNFAHSGCPPRYTKLQTWELPMQYEHEIYLQLTAGDDGIPEKTANQLHLELHRLRMRRDPKTTSLRASTELLFLILFLFHIKTPTACQIKSYSQHALASKDTIFRLFAINDDVGDSEDNDDRRSA
ncbi:hypothetical protein FQN53_004927 [Emmonsiellopsis sp. PD_33]|nr:hypothetical protein FQN53_004927 [Emmonsiellopsis sp. PD_33]